MKDDLPRQGRLAGLDYGTVRIGVAITDPDQKLASPLANYTRRTLAADAAWLTQLVKDEHIAGFVVGLPIHMSGDESEKSREARQFADWVRQTTGLPALLHDERFSTSHADDLLGAHGLTKKQKKDRRDKLAAQIILLSFLESRGGHPSGPIDDA
jgi:putative Holliday junction resolvase